MRTSFNPSRFTLGFTVLFATAIACDSAPEKVLGAIPIKPPVVQKEATGQSETNNMIAVARAATAKFHNIEEARASGYIDDGFGCISDPSLGGMGFHLINLAIDTDPAIDVRRPELLIYEPTANGKMRLVAVEYEVFQADWWAAGNTEAPSLFGQEFEAVIFPGLDPIFALHVWLWRHNPSGMFADFNPKVSCP